MGSNARRLGRADVRRAAVGIVVASGATATALSLAFALDPVVEQSAFIVFLAAVTVSARFAGLFAGLLATLLGGLAFTFFLTEPSYSLVISGSSIVIDLAIFGLASLLINVLYVHLRRAQRREKSARDTAEEAVRLRDGFLAAAAHDLSNPLTAILGTCQLMTRRVDASPMHDAERCATAVRNIESNARRLGAQIEELLDVAQAESGRQLGLRHAPVDLVDLVRRVVAARASTARRHDVRLQTELQHLIATCDAVRLERVIDNLVVNALKYSPFGGVVALTLSREHAANGEWAVLAIRDEGLGVPTADLERIFEPFRRAGNVGPISGTGIGLASARQIVEEHRGQIGVASREGVGSTFTVRLPLGPQVAEPLTLDGVGNATVGAGRRHPPS